MTKASTTAVVLVALFSVLLSRLHHFFRTDSLQDATSSLTSMGTNDYNIRPVNSPILVGWKLEAMAWLARSMLGPAVLHFLRRKNDIDCVRRLAAELMDASPLYFPIPSKKNAEGTNEAPFDLGPLWENKENVKAHTPPGHASDGFAFDSIADYVQAYTSGDVTPVQVVEAYLEIVQESNSQEPPLKAILDLDEDQKQQMLKEAQESASRYAQGTTLGPLDGILVAIKDGEDVRGFPTYKGTSFLGDERGKAQDDGSITTLLRQAGAILAGKTNMHEIGLGTTGYNLHWGTVRNPYDPHHYTGGSSSGSAAAVSAGLVPLALAVDAGGSIRIPAALCGVVGLKATFDRISTPAGTCPSMGHSGPIATSVLDTAIGYLVMAGPQADASRMTQPKQEQPPPHAKSLTQASKDLKGLRIGIFPEHFEDAQDAQVQDCFRVLRQLQDLGATVVNVTIPHLQQMNMAHSIIISTEMAQFMDGNYHRVEELSPEIQITMELGRTFSGRDFLAAQRVRRYAMKVVEELFETTMDVYVSPSTAIVAPKIPPEALEFRGESNLVQTAALMRYMQLGNLVGIPGLSFPIGYTSEGIPTSMMVQAAHWNEDVLFRVASAVESPRMRPKVYYSVLDRARQNSSR